MKVKVSGYTRNVPKHYKTKKSLASYGSRDKSMRLGGKRVSKTRYMNEIERLTKAFAK